MKYPYFDATTDIIHALLFGKERSVGVSEASRSRVKRHGRNSTHNTQIAGFEIEAGDFT